ncbi:MAG: aminoacyl-histidine dipeptidase, partial [Fibrobacter sp.]|nr:aminoacyl-histidine dipeptidase [Fibrobacter sp.]
IDEAGNVLIKKEASRSKENCPTVVLQSHLDMVPQKNNDKVHDFLKDPIEPVISGEWVKANGTTLGADDGIGVAAMLAILESKDIEHGPLELLFTIDEETGMSGANGLSPKLLTGKKYINLDSEDDGVFAVGCAGGINATGTMIYEQEKCDSAKCAYKLVVKGLRGGHSGIDINLGRANAVKLMNRLLFSASGIFDIKISEFCGGSARNAIPREAFAVVTVPECQRSQFESFVDKTGHIYKSEYISTDPDILVETSTVSVPDTVMSAKAQKRIIEAIYACPTGVIRMDQCVENLVETSTNLSFADCRNGKAVIKCLLRSSIDSVKNDLENSVFSALELAGFDVTFSGSYPGWRPDMSSELLDTLKTVYQNMYNKEPEIEAVHAGLECGIIGAHYPDMDMVSCGPTIQFPHSPDERVNIQSVKRFWDFLVSVLKQI